MFTIHLHNLKFFSYHGVHEEEKILGNDFEVNIDVSFEESGRINFLNQTVDYSRIYDAVAQRMTVQTALLETLAQDLAQVIQKIDNSIILVSIKILKLNVPINGFEGKAGVTYQIEF